MLTVTLVRRIASVDGVLVASVAHGTVVVAAAISARSGTAIVLVLIISAASTEAKRTDCVSGQFQTEA